MNAAGIPVAELTTENAEIRWTVHLANKKSAWYQFQIALDIPEADSAPPSWLRNMTISDRASLVIDPGRAISSAAMPAAARITHSTPANSSAQASISARSGRMRRVG